MRELLTRMDDVTDNGFEDRDRRRELLRDILANILAAQAVAAASVQGGSVSAGDIRSWVEAVAGYPGVTMEHIGGETIGDRAEQIARRLLEVAPR